MNLAVDVCAEFTGHIHFLAIPPRGRKRSIAFISDLNSALDSKFKLANNDRLHFANLSYAEFLQYGEILPKFFGQDRLHFSQEGALALKRKIENYCREFYDRPEAAHTDLTQILLDANLDTTINTLPRTPSPMPPTMKTFKIPSSTPKPKKSIAPYVETVTPTPTPTVKPQTPTAKPKTPTVKAKTPTAKPSTPTALPPTSDDMETDEIDDSKVKSVSFIFESSLGNMKAAKSKFWRFLKSKGQIRQVFYLGKKTLVVQAKNEIAEEIFKISSLEEIFGKNKFRKTITAKKNKKRKTQEGISKINSKKMKRMDKWEAEMRLQLEKKEKENAELRLENREMFSKLKDAENEAKMTKIIYEEKCLEEFGKNPDFSRAERRLLRKD